MQFHAQLLALFLAATAAVPALGQTTDQPPCEAVPNDFWFCISDCLYKTCPGDDVCYRACDAACKAKFVPDCEPGIN
ncbi:hypothetical protein C8A00DRAFT_37499 [Chaetomidium leptoderma]|uniref:Uncharacterized protein n=1 Tax=Chaetomidium leptoderma TaxID=669021 RepID=A0AAN6ZS75_9PEZI|nr:hypothetical protein C8A00DRAFT_37499 [Chaetomidium leptoderma]